MEWDGAGMAWSGLVDWVDGWWKRMSFTRLGMRKPAGTLKRIRRLRQEGNGHFWSWGISLSKKWEHQAHANITDITSIDIDGIHLPVMFLYILQYSASQQAFFFFSLFYFLVLSYFCLFCFDRHYTFLDILCALY